MAWKRKAALIVVVALVVGGVWWWQTQPTTEKEPPPDEEDQPYITFDNAELVSGVASVTMRDDGSVLVQEHVMGIVSFSFEIHNEGLAPATDMRFAEFPDHDFSCERGGVSLPCRLDIPEGEGFDLGPGEEMTIVMTIDMHGGYHGTLSLVDGTTGELVPSDGHIEVIWAP